MIIVRVSIGDKFRPSTLLMAVLINISIRKVTKSVGGISCLISYYFNRKVASEVGEGGGLGRMGRERQKGRWSTKMVLLDQREAPAYQEMEIIGRQNYPYNPQLERF